MHFTFDLFYSASCRTLTLTNWNLAASVRPLCISSSTRRSCEPTEILPGDSSMSGAVPSLVSQVTSTLSTERIGSKGTCRRWRTGV